MRQLIAAAFIVGVSIHGFLPAQVHKAAEESHEVTQGGPADPDWKQLEELFRTGDRGAHERLVAEGVAAIPLLAKILHDPSAGTARFSAANALGDIAASECVDPLLRALRDPWFNVRRCAAIALGTIGDPRARGPLRRVAEKDPYSWVDPETGKSSYLVRIDARRALAMLDAQREAFLEDAAHLPPLGFQLPRAPCPWPFPGGFRLQHLYNNYQQPTDSYIHAGMDLLQDAGTIVRAVEAGTVAVIATNYPDWKTHHFFIVEPKPGRGEGWCYTHVDPDSFTFKVGEKIRVGQVLGKVVDFSVGKNDGIDHLHLNYVSFKVAPDGKVAFHSLYDPLLRFDWRDEKAPTVFTPFHFVRNGSSTPLGLVGKVPRLGGKVDILVAIADNAYAGHIANWMTPVVTLEITAKGVRPWRKLVLDQRGPIEDARQVAPLYLGFAARASLVEGLPRNPVAHVLRVTNTDGDGVIEPTDARFAWDTAQRDERGQRRFPDGVYEVIVRAWDLAGNRGEGRMRVRVVND
ncbi:MAG TPA: hypothetical protein ENK43_16235 [Planctomycetes bacterium]|nr:hypothetical protein [Planctomycetota bacterium]